MNQRDIAERLETKQFLLRQPLLRERPRPNARQQRRGRRGYLEKIAPRNHALLLTGR
jgi:hypothetical protein